MAPIYFPRSSFSKQSWLKAKLQLCLAHPLEMKSQRKLKVNAFGCSEIGGGAETSPHFEIPSPSVRIQPESLLLATDYARHTSATMAPSFFLKQGDKEHQMATTQRIQVLCESQLVKPQILIVTH